jgi:hypothetical protein
LVGRLKAAGYNDTLTLEVFDANRKMLVDSRVRIEALFADGPSDKGTMDSRGCC